jgi:hypothetical protein
VVRTPDIDNTRKGDRLVQGRRQAGQGSATVEARLPLLDRIAVRLASETKSTDGRRGTGVVWRANTRIAALIGCSERRRSGRGQCSDDDERAVDRRLAGDQDAPQEAATPDPDPRQPGDLRCLHEPAVARATLVHRDAQVTISLSAAHVSAFSRADEVCRDPLERVVDACRWRRAPPRHDAAVSTRPTLGRGSADRRCALAGTGRASSLLRSASRRAAYDVRRSLARGGLLPRSARSRSGTGPASCAQTRRSRHRLTRMVEPNPVSIRP